MFFPDVASIEVLPRHFGYRNREFPYMAKFVLYRFGYEGLGCLALTLYSTTLMVL